MSSVTSFAAEPDRAKIQLDLIDDDQQIFNRDLFFLQPISHGFSAEIHICIRLEQNQRSALILCFSYLTKGNRFPLCLQFISQTVYCLKTNIMPCQSIFRSDIAQSRDKIFHKWIKVEPKIVNRKSNYLWSMINSKPTFFRRPQEGDCAPYYFRYTDLVPTDVDITTFLHIQRDLFGDWI